MSSFGTNRIARLHGAAMVWWVSQFLLYLLRPQPSLQQVLNKTVENQNFQHPIVGVQIRRTDKIGTEAAFHPVEEYMKYVEEFYVQYELTHKVEVRRVYVASDDPMVLGECRQKFPKYEFLGNRSVAQSAATSSRYSVSSQ